MDVRDMNGNPECGKNFGGFQRTCGTALRMNDNGSLMQQMVMENGRVMHIIPMSSSEVNRLPEMK